MQWGLGEALGLSVSRHPFDLHVTSWHGSGPRSPHFTEMDTWWLADWAVVLTGKCRLQPCVWAFLKETPTLRGGESPRCASVSDTRRDTCEVPDVLPPASGVRACCTVGTAFPWACRLESVCLLLPVKALYVLCCGAEHSENATSVLSGLESLPLAGQPGTRPTGPSRVCVTASSPSCPGP